MTLSVQRNARAQVGDAARTQDAPPAEAANPQNAETLQKVQAAEAKLEQFLKENGEWLNEEETQQAEFLLQTLKAEEAAIQGFGINGAPEDQNGDGAITDEDFVQRPTELQDGWNGHYILSGTGEPGDERDFFSKDKEFIEANSDKYGTFEGTVEIEAGSATGIAFSMSPTDKDLVVESHGRDLIVTITDVNNDHRSYVIREGSVRPDPIIIDATKAAQDVYIDLSRAFRVSDGGYNAPAGTVSGFYVHGSEFNDTIYGSQGDDKIVGWAGDDTIDAMGGKDSVFGDEFYLNAGDFRSDYGGRDNLNGGAGEDVIYGGGNIDTRYSSDNSDNNEYPIDTENNRGNEVSNIPADREWIETGDVATRVEDGMVVVGRSDAVSIDMSKMDDFNMAFAEGGENGSLIITFVGENDDGSPKTFKVKIEDFFNSTASTGTHLTINGSGVDDIIDFSKLTGEAYQLKNQVLEIHGGAGNDMILGAENKLQRQGVTIDSLYRNSAGNAPAALQGFIDDGIVHDNTDAEEKDAFEPRVDGNKIHIDSTSLGGPDAPAPEDATLYITAPAGYSEAYISEVGDMRYITLVQPGDPAKTIVIEMKISILPDVSKIQINSKGVDDQLGQDIPTTYLDIEINEVIDGRPVSRIIPSFITLDNGEDGTDNDIIYAQKGSTVHSDRTDFVVEGDSGAPGLDHTPGRNDDPIPPPPGGDNSGGDA